MNNVENILVKVADYIAVTQPRIDEYNERREAFLKRANQIAGVLSTRGILPRERVDEFLAKVAQDQTGNCAWDLVEKLAETVAADSLGSASEIKVADPRKMDAFERWVTYGDPNAQPAVSGTVE